MLDVGCGGGILAEAMARARRDGHRHRPVGQGAARSPSCTCSKASLTVTYESISAEDFAERHAGAFDVVTCMELLEHVPEPASMVAACARLVRPGGQVFFSTINRNPKSYLFAVIGAEYVLRPAAEGHARLRALHQALRARALVPRARACAPTS